MTTHVNVVSCCVKLSHVTSCQIMSCQVSSCHVKSCRDCLFRPRLVSVNESLLARLGHVFELSGTLGLTEVNPSSLKPWIHLLASSVAAALATIQRDNTMYIYIYIYVYIHYRSLTRSLAYSLAPSLTYSLLYLPNPPTTAQ